MCIRDRVTILERNSQFLAEGYEPQLGRMVERVFTEEGIAVETLVRF